jgi:hypothetical protein
MATKSKSISYFKFTKVDQESGFSVLIYPSSNKIFPELPNLNVFFGEGDWFYGTADSSAKENRVNNIVELSHEQILEDFRGRLPAMKQESFNRISDEYQQLLKIIRDSYDEEDSPIGLIRYQDAKNYLLNGSISDNLKLEVDLSGANIETLSNNIISKYEEYISNLYALTALKTKICNRINDFSLADSSFIEDFSGWHSKVENIGNKNENTFLNNDTVINNIDTKFDVEGNCTLRFYSPSLKIRWGIL